MASSQTIPAFTIRRQPLIYFIRDEDPKFMKMKHARLSWKNPDILSANNVKFQVSPGDKPQRRQAA
jgi:hypothetical protein